MGQTELHKITTFDGVDYIMNNGKTRFLLLPTPSGWGMPSISFNTERGYKENRLREFGYSLDERTVIISQTTQGCSREEYFDERSALLDVTRPNRSLSSAIETPSPVTFTFITKELVKRAIIGRPISPIFSGSKDDEWDEWAFDEDIEIECFDPIWFDPDTITEIDTSGISSVALIFPAFFDSPGGEWLFSAGALVFSIAITYQESDTALWYTYPVIKIIGPATSWILTHDDLGLTITYPVAVASGETLTLDLANKTLTSSLGGSRWGFLSVTSDIIPFRLHPHPTVTNGINTLSLAVGGGVIPTTQFQVEYNRRYIGF